MIKQIINVLFLLLLVTTISCGQETKSDSVSITFNISTPEETPEDATIFWAGDLNSWDSGDKGIGFSSLDKSRPLVFKYGSWQITIRAPIDSKVNYKYTRGSIFSVEELPDYTYKDARQVTFDTNKIVYDTVSTWHDIPPKEIADLWPHIQLEPAKLNITFNGREIGAMPRGNAILNAEDKANAIYDFSNSEVEIQSIPPSFIDPIFYYLKVSPESDNLIGVVAAKTDTTENRNIYVDKNNDKIIAHDELILSTKTNESNRWTGNIVYQSLGNSKVVSDTVELSIFRANDLPQGYGSSNNPKAPNLTYTLPYKHRKGEMGGSNFYLTSDFSTNFKNFLFISVDRNKDGNIAIESGSNETVSMDYRAWKMQNKYYIHPKIEIGGNPWEIANISSKGEWIRFRPSTYAKKNKILIKGEQAPLWKGKTLSGETISSNSLRGEYVLFDFWGSWCGPCIEAIPDLKVLYEKFKSDNFEIVGFAYENNSSLKKALDRYKLPWPQIADIEGKFKNIFNVQGYPTYYLIGPEGRIVALDQDLSGGQMYQIIKEYLSK